MYAQALIVGYNFLIYDPSVTAKRVLLIIASANQASSPIELIPSHIHVLSHCSIMSHMFEGIGTGGGGGE
jgi:hypothetical protein